MSSQGNRSFYPFPHDDKRAEVEMTYGAEMRKAFEDPAAAQAAREAAAEYERKMRAIASEIKHAFETAPASSGGKKSKKAKKSKKSKKAGKKSKKSKKAGKKSKKSRK